MARVYLKLSLLCCLLTMACSTTKVNSSSEKDINCGFLMNTVKVCSVYNGKESCSCEPRSQKSLFDTSPNRPAASPTLFGH